MTTLEPQTVDRGGDVPPYRARKPPEAVPVKLCGFDSGVLVLRCHDVHVAGEAIRAAILSRVVSPTLVTGQPRRIWVRFVLDDYSNPAAGGVWERELRGTIAATPAVLYAREVGSCRHVFPDGTRCQLTSHDAPGLAQLHGRGDVPS